MSYRVVATLGGEGVLRRAISFTLPSFVDGITMTDMPDLRSLRAGIASGSVPRDADALMCLPAGADRTQLARDIRDLRCAAWEGGLVVVLFNPGDRTHVVNTPLVPGILRLGDAPGFRLIEHPWSLRSLVESLQSLDGFSQEAWMDMTATALPDLMANLSRILQSPHSANAHAALGRAAEQAEDVGWRTLVPHSDIRKLDHLLACLRDSSRGAQDRINALQEVFVLAGLPIPRAREIANL
jgi:hypothetical protein